MRVMLGLAMPLLVACGGLETSFRQNTSDVTAMVGAGTMDLSEEALVWDDAKVLVALSQTLVVTNVSPEDVLHVRSAIIINDSLDAFYTDEEANEDVKLNPDGTRELIIVCKLQELEVSEAALRIESNDPDMTIFELPLTCNPTEADSGG